mmetsp:Transcript_52591/g.117917  ORF Transcript_52591/g.117917 Transcript_52591/m.117917 type:complete len:246 (+) Transcript_52591:341-1078(+)
MYRWRGAVHDDLVNCLLSFDVGRMCGVKRLYGRNGDLLLLLLLCFRFDNACVRCGWLAVQYLGLLRRPLNCKWPVACVDWFHALIGWRVLLCRFCVLRLFFDFGPCTPDGHAAFLRITWKILELCLGETLLLYGPQRWLCCRFRTIPGKRTFAADSGLRFLHRSLLRFPIPLHFMKALRMRVRKALRELRFGNNRSSFRGTLLLTRKECRHNCRLADHHARTTQRGKLREERSKPGRKSGDDPNL